MSTDGEDSTWWRGCKVLNNQTLGCSEHKWFPPDGPAVLVDECVCDKNLCNQDIGPIPETTSTVKTTTTNGI